MYAVYIHIRESFPQLPFAFLYIESERVTYRPPPPTPRALCAGHRSKALYRYGVEGNRQKKEEEKVGWERRWKNDRTSVLEVKFLHLFVKVLCDNCALEGGFFFCNGELHFKGFFMLF